jgi:hypothetical protein
MGRFLYCRNLLPLRRKIYANGVRGGLSNMTYTQLFNEIAWYDLVVLVGVFACFSILEVYFRYKFGKNAWKCDLLFNSILIMLNGFIIYMMLDSRTEKNSVSLFVFGIAVIQTCKLLRDTSNEIADYFRSKNEHDKKLIEIERDSHEEMLNILNSLNDSDEQIKMNKLEIIKRIMNLEKQLIKYE